MMLCAGSLIIIKKIKVHLSVAVFCITSFHNAPLNSFSLFITQTLPQAFSFVIILHIHLIKNIIMLMTFSYHRNRILHLMQIDSVVDNLHEISELLSWKNKKNISCSLLKILPSMLSDNVSECFG